MFNYLRPINRLMFLLALALLPYGIIAQNFTGVLQQVEPPESVKKVLNHWEIYQINAQEIKQFVQNAAESAPFQLQLGNRQLDLQLQPSNILSPDYFLQVSTEAGIKKYSDANQRAFKGFETKSGGMVRLTLDKNFIHGFINLADEAYFIEPLWYHQPDADRDLFLFYPESAVNKDQDVTCIELASEEDLGHLKYTINDKADTPESLACYELELAIASDNSMFNKYGSVSAVENHNIAVINDVEGLYTGSFNHDIVFIIVTQFVVTGADPWTNSTAAGTLLGSFRSWGNAGGFGVSFDNGELWTNRNFDGSTVGIAYLGGICNNNKYHCLQDYTSNSLSLRGMTAHEIGHNFSASHDIGPGDCPPNYVMCPFVNSSTNWSSQSQSQMNAYMQNKINSGCLEACGGNPPLVADFDWSPNEPCVGDPVQFTDMSSGNISNRTWSFPGGSPTSSTQTNPTVTYFAPGTFTVTLTLSGVGGPVSSEKQIVVKPEPTADFTYLFDDLTYTFTSTSTNAFSYSWDFGDGIGYSNDQNPVYTYPEAGIYNVTLFVENDCGTATKTALIVTVPTANFTADPTSGCAALTVQFTNESSANANSYLWQFPGGQPTSSSQSDPVVVYTTSGQYNVTLTAFNGAGSSTTTFTNYVSVQNVPAANFTKTIDDLTVTFTSTSVGATSYHWDFGDGDTSILMNPVHTYLVGGSYTVTLTAMNDCGSTTSTQSVVLIAPPAASFTTDITSGCGPLTVQFTSTSTGNPDAYNWSFPGGDPSSSSAENPVVVYNNPGSYTVSLTVSNAGGANTATQTNLITVGGAPAAGFTSNVNLDTAQFANTTTGALSYNWDFGDNTSSTASDPEHIYDEDGIYIVTLISTNDCGSDTVTQTITIVTFPIAGFTATPTSGCGPLTVQFTSTSSANSTGYNWNFTGGTPANSNEQNPIVTYNSPGTYTVTLTVSNAAGSNTATQTNYVTVNAGPTAGFTSMTNGAVVTFNNTSTNSTSYNWDFGDMSTSMQQNPTHSYDEDGTYTVTLTTTNPCGTSTFTETITIVTPPTAGFTASTTSGCDPLTVTFTNTSSINATTFNWTFPGGTPGTSTEENPTVVYAIPGTYTVTLVASNSAGSSTSTQTSYITVNTGPSAGFSTSVDGANATFTNTSTNSTSYNWDFGDMSTSMAQNPTHNYTEDGTYTVTLTATNPCGTSTFTETITIVTPPTAGFTASTTSGCDPLTVTFTNASSINATTFNWTFQGGTPGTSTEENPTVVYTAPGTYTVTLVASNSAGSSTSTQTSYITVNTGPSAGFSTSVDGANATFTNTSTNSTSYNWDFGDMSTSMAQNPTHNYTEDGTYTVTLTATNPCGTSTFTETVTIVLPPLSAFAPNVTEGCAPLEVQFTNQSSANATDFAWTFEGGTPPTSNDAEPTVVFDQPGVYTVTLVASNAAGSSTSTSTITVLGPPTISFTSQTAGLSVVLTNNSTNADSYKWEFGDMEFSVEENPTHTYETTGSYTVILTASNDCGTTVDSQFVEIIGSAPIPLFTADEIKGCAPFTVQFTDQSAGAPSGWSWTFEGGDPSSSTEQNPLVTYNTPGVYAVTLEVSNLFGSNTDTQSGYITVLDFPTANFTFDADQITVSFTNNSLNGDAYSWNFGDGKTSTEMNPVHTYDAPGMYTVELTVVNNCGASTLQQMITLVSGINEVAWLDAFRLYPNPSSGIFTVEMTGDAQKNLEFVLYNSIGQLVDRQTAEFGTGALKRNFDYTNQSAGMYTLLIRSGQSVAQVKIAIQR